VPKPQPINAAASILVERSSIDSFQGDEDAFPHNAVAIPQTPSASQISREAHSKPRHSGISKPHKSMARRQVKWVKELLLGEL
jgi:hypothetical protein